MGLYDGITENGSVATLPLSKSAPAIETDEQTTDAAVNVTAALLDLVGRSKGKIDPAQLASIERRVSALESRPPTTITFAHGEWTSPTIENARPELIEIVRRVRAGFSNIWLAGPAGSGKTTLAKTLADALGLSFGFQSFNATSSTGDLIGTPTADGRWIESAFVSAYENGGVYLLDELDAASGEIVLAINAALANGHLSIPRHPDASRRIITRHKDCVVVAAGNTWGTGPDAQYVGRSQLDAATLDRFTGARFTIGYDDALEERILPDAKLLEMVRRMRKLCEENRIRRIVGTRSVVAAAKMHAAGFSPKEVYNALTEGWTTQDLAKMAGVLA